MVHLLTDNILFSSKIAQGLRSGGAEVRVFTDPDALRAAEADEIPEALLVNLNARGFSPADLIRSLKAEGFPAPIVAFCGHSDEATRRSGVDAGADRVLANSAITMNALGALKDAGIDLTNGRT
ncbi:MAG TPA: response regulator [Armatimonadota bacterium]|jgi:DNA-binding response OmpR family regulator